MKLDLQAINPKTGKVVSVLYDTENPPTLEDVIYESMLDILSCEPRLTQAQREKIARDRAKEAARLKAQGKPPFANSPVPTRAELEARRKGRRHTGKRKR